MRYLFIIFWGVDLLYNVVLVSAVPRSESAVCIQISPPERMKAGTKWERQSVVYVSGDESKVQCCKEQYCIGI